MGIRSIGVLAWASVVISVGAGTQGPVPPPAPPGATTYMTWQSDPGDYIGGGTSRADTWDTAAFSATVSADRRSVSITVKPIDATNWTLNFGATPGSSLVPGTYDLATRFGSPSQPSLDIYGDGRGCNQVTGRFIVYEASYSTSGTIDRFRAVFEQHCEGASSALIGEISLTAPFAPAPALPPPPPAPPSAPPIMSTLHFDSDAGDYIGQGKIWDYTVETAAFTPLSPGTHGVHLFVTTATTSWSLDFEAKIGLPLVPGIYDGATRYPFQSPVAPGLSVTGDGRGCNAVTGRFIVYEAVFDASNSLTRFRATFEQYCDNAIGALRGEVAYIASVVNPPVNVGDFTGDSKPDLIWQHPATGAVLMWEMNGGAYVRGALLNQGPTLWQVVGAADMTGDGKVDLIWQHPLTGKVLLWAMDGTTLINGAYLSSSSTTWKVVAVADMTGDNKPDLVWQDPATGAVELWEMDGPAKVSVTTLSLGSTLWQVVGVADFTGDGKNDLLWQHPATGAVLLWQMDNSDFVTGDFVSTGGTYWKVRAVADYTGDGHPDIIWQHPVTGAVLLWEMSGPSYVRGTIVNDGGTYWQVKGPR